MSSGQILSFHTDPAIEDGECRCISLPSVSSYKGFSPSATANLQVEAVCTHCAGLGWSGVEVLMVRDWLGGFEHNHVDGDEKGVVWRWSCTAKRNKKRIDQLRDREVILTRVATSSAVTDHGVRNDFKGNTLDFGGFLRRYDH
jgi:hypothetical protein